MNKLILSSIAIIATAQLILISTQYPRPAQLYVDVFTNLASIFTLTEHKSGAAMKAPDFYETHAMLIVAISNILIALFPLLLIWFSKKKHGSNRFHPKIAFASILTACFIAYTMRAEFFQL